MSKVKNAIRVVVGRTAELLLPGLGREIDETRRPENAPKLKRAILYARVRRATARGDIAEIEQTLTSFWKGDAAYHDRFVEERFDLFREQHAVMIKALAELLERSEGRFTRLVEVGCGDGRVLAYCADRLPSITQAIGLDINAAIIQRISAEPHADPRLSFVNADAREWLSANPQPCTVVLANNGVLEFISQQSFDKLLQTLAQTPPVVIALVEPVALAHDLSRQMDSFVFGDDERSFSHNHRQRLTSAGFEITFEQEMPVWGIRLMLMMGVIN